MIAPTGPFFPGFTFNAVLSGMIYGLILYKHPVTVPRVLFSQFLVKVFVNLLLNTYWLSILYGKGFMMMLPARVVSNAVMLPIDTVLTFVILKFVWQLWTRSGMTVSE